MRFEQTIVRHDGSAVCERCCVADTSFRRMRGLLGRSELPAGEGILIRPTSAVHTWFMRFAIDVVFLDRDGLVLHVAPELKPWRAAARRRAKAVLELAAGECERRELRPGDRLRICDA